jgi:DNA-3-methyladenine glycosylase
MAKILTAQFFRRPVLEVAPQLLGKYVVYDVFGNKLSSMITEVEAYDGCDDLACHASRGRTARTEVMYASGGVWYIYLVYGMHEMLNIVTGPKDYPAAVLIRGLADASGPGRVTRQFGIDRRLNGTRAGRQSGLWIEDRGIIIDPKNIKRAPRIGVNYAGPIWSEKPYRFMI